MEKPRDIASRIVGRFAGTKLTGGPQRDLREAIETAIMANRDTIAKQLTGQADDYLQMRDSPANAGPAARAKRMELENTSRVLRVAAERIRKGEDYGAFVEGS